MKDSKELLGVLIDIADGKRDFAFTPSYIWSGATTTSLEFLCDGYRILLSVDAGELDYVDNATNPQGDVYDFGWWSNADGYEEDPIDGLTDGQIEQLKQRFANKSGHMRGR